MGGNLLMMKFPCRVVGILDVKELTAGIMKPGVKIEHLSGRIITANGGMNFPDFLACLI